MKKYILFFLLFITLGTYTVLAHPGNTDKYGGHYDRSTGLYHFHNAKEVQNNTANTTNNNPVKSNLSILNTPIEQLIKTWDRERLENAYVQNVKYYSDEAKRLENEKNSINEEYSKLQNGFEEEKNKTLDQETKIKSIETKNKNIILQRNVLGFIAVSLLGFIIFMRINKKV